MTKLDELMQLYDTLTPESRKLVLAMIRELKAAQPSEEQNKVQGEGAEADEN